MHPTIKTKTIAEEDYLLVDRHERIKIGFENRNNNGRLAE